MTCALVASFSLEAAAQGDDTEAAVMALDRQASTLFEAGDYADALERMEAAQQLLPSTVRVYNIAVCQERIGDLSGAVISYQRFLDEGGEPEERRGRAEARIAHLQGELEQDTAPPEHFDASDRQRERRRLSPAFFYALLGLSAAAGVAWIATGAVALHYQSKFEGTVEGSPAGDSYREQGEPYVTGCNVMIGVTATSALATVIVALFTRWRTHEARRSRGARVGLWRDALHAHSGWMPSSLTPSSQ